MLIEVPPACPRFYPLLASRAEQTDSPMNSTEPPYFAETSSPAGREAAMRIGDASANRAGEALRVIEDFVRFALDDALLTERAKSLRHELTEILAAMPREDRLRARQTQEDVGTTISTSGEAQRGTLEDVVRAAFGRLQQALRSLEECAKVIAPQAAGPLEQLRYRVYTLESAIHITHESGARLESLRLCVLVDGAESLTQCENLVGRLLEAGVSAVQLREKDLDDRELLALARRLREMTAAHGALLVVNDRADMASLVRADGLHLGQEDLPIAEARKVVGTEMLIGLSTHSLAQAEEAVMAGADYIGVGPVFPSTTKEFHEYPGLALVRQVAERLSLPALAIGGIGPENIEAVMAAGATRVAVGRAITATPDPAAAASELMARMQLPTGC